MNFLGSHEFQTLALFIHTVHFACFKNLRKLRMLFFRCTIFPCLIILFFDKNTFDELFSKNDKNIFEQTYVCERNHIQHCSHLASSYFRPSNDSRMFSEWFLMVYEKMWFRLNSSRRVTTPGKLCENKSSSAWLD